MSKSDKLIEYLTGDSVRLDENIVEAELANIGALIQNEKPIASASKALKKTQAN